MIRTTRYGRYGAVVGGAMVALSFSAEPAHAATGSFRFGLGADYEQLQGVDLRSFQTEPFGGGAGTSLSGKMSGQRGLLHVTYQLPPSVEVAVYGGFTFNAELNGIQDASGDLVTENWKFATSPTFGMGIKVDTLHDTRFHITPQLQILNSFFHGTQGTVTHSASGCSYDYTSNGSTPSCPSIGGNDGGTIQSSAYELLFRTKLEFALDAFSDINRGVTFRGGVLEEVSSIFASIDHTKTGSGTATENYNFISLRPLGVFGGLTAHTGPIDYGAEVVGISTLTYRIFATVSL